MKVFVFGSNLHGFHLAGSAKAAWISHGAKWGVGVGLSGNSYAIPTLDGNLKKLDLDIINHYVRQFLKFAEMHSDMQFNVVAIGCGIAGFTPEQIVPMFEGASKNVNLPEEFLK